MVKLNLGCGLSTHDGWVNYDNSPRLKLQRLPLVGHFFKLLKPTFPSEVFYGDITTRIPAQSNSVDFIYSSHMLEHLSLEDFKLALHEIYRLLKPGGVFRGVVPDLEASIEVYLSKTNPEAGSEFLKEINLGIEKKPKGVLSKIKSILGSSCHLWMWDYKGISFELDKVGYINISRAFFNDSNIQEFMSIEKFDRWNHCLGFECQKPI